MRHRRRRTVADARFFAGIYGILSLPALGVALLLGGLAGLLLLFFGLTCAVLSVAFYREALIEQEQHEAERWR